MFYVTLMRVNCVIIIYKQSYCKKYREIMRNMYEFFFKKFKELKKMSFFQKSLKFFSENVNTFDNIILT